MTVRIKVIMRVTVTPPPPERGKHEDKIRGETPRGDQFCDLMMDPYNRT